MSAWKKYASQARSTAKPTQSVMTHTIPAFISMRVSTKVSIEFYVRDSYIKLKLDHYH